MIGKQSFHVIALMLLCLPCDLLRGQVDPHLSRHSVFPGQAWEHRSPASMGMDAQLLDGLAKKLGGRGCVIRSGFVVKAWGDQSQVSDWLSSAKPVISTLLFFAIEEGMVQGVDQPIADFGWELNEKDRGITFRHLGSMSSGYARPESAGQAWAYNDFAIQLYQKTLFDRVYRGADARQIAEAPQRLGGLNFEDGLLFSNKRRISASVRDFARIVWFWRNRGKWNGRQILPEKYFTQYMRPQTPKELPATLEAETDDYLGIQSYGGGSDHFTKSGPGVYGFNWWFNSTGRQHPYAMTWPDAPPDTVMSCGARGNNAAFIPSLDLALVCAEGDWSDLSAGEPRSKINQALKLVAAAAGYHATEKVAISGTLKKWQPLTLTFTGPECSESGTPNPFVDFRVDVDFRKGDRTLTIPGFFAADGNAGHTGATSGNRWRVHFTPDESGEWKYNVRFRSGNRIAISAENATAEPIGFEGLNGDFDIQPADPKAAGFYSRGGLRYVGERYLRFAETGEPFLKGGVDSPENFLAFADFDGTIPTHTYEAHAADALPSDPTWKDGKGKNIMGVLRYLYNQRINSIYFLTMNVNGDGKDVWPWTHQDERMRYDCSKLDQWEYVFQQMDRLGISMHVVHQEQENDQLLDDGALGEQRKLYYRELVARFAHHPALIWNLGEENTNTTEQQKAFAEYIRHLDAYQHPIVIHTFPKQVSTVYEGLLGDRNIDGPSFQFGNVRLTHAETLRWISRSAAAGKIWFACLDEIGPASTCLPPDIQDPEHLSEVREGLWGNLMAGGAGVEWIVAYDTWPRLPHKHLDVACENFRPWENMWRKTAIALDFFKTYLPFDRMTAHDEWVDTDKAWCLANADEIFAVYLFGGQSTSIELPQGVFSVSWYDPHRGGSLKVGEDLQGPGRIRLGNPPQDGDRDWVAIVKKRLVD